MTPLHIGTFRRRCPGIREWYSRGWFRRALQLWWIIQTYLDHLETQYRRIVFTTSQLLHLCRCFGDGYISMEDPKGFYPLFFKNFLVHTSLYNFSSCITIKYSHPPNLSLKHSITVPSPATPSRPTLKPTIPGLKGTVKGLIVTLTIFLDLDLSHSADYDIELIARDNISVGWDGGCTLGSTGIWGWVYGISGSVVNVSSIKYVYAFSVFSMSDGLGLSLLLKRLWPNMVNYALTLVFF